MRRPEAWRPGDVAVSRDTRRRMLRVVRVELDEGDPWPALVYDDPGCTLRRVLPPRVSSFWFRHASPAERRALGDAPATPCACCRGAEQFSSVARNRRRRR